MKTVPTVPLAVVALVITGTGNGAGAMFSVSVAVPVPVPLVAESETLNAPEAVGVPVIAPVAVLTLNPAGSPEAPKLAGELLAVIV